MLKFTEIAIKGHELGGLSIIPDIHDPAENHWVKCDETVPEKDRENLGNFVLKTKLPYKMQNQYTRELKDIKLKVAVLENDYLKAVFLTEFGGRLWQLYDKKNGKDVVYCNDALRLGNLAIRNAWFAGGIEFNFGIMGHTPMTCDKMFVQHLKSKDGRDILKMYEYESISKSPYAIYATLVDDELIFKMEIQNANDKPIFSYWWTNVAAPHTKETRVFVPAEEAFITGYRDGGHILTKKKTPTVNGVDISYARTAPDSVDYFYDIPKENKKWCSSIEGDGYGVLHSSSDLLVGRKTFIWGNIAGGRHWDEWLTGGRNYLEIQAGILKTQYECFHMDAKEKRVWYESFKGIQIDPAVKDGDYYKAVEVIDGLSVNPEGKKDIFEGATLVETVGYGSGKGALHELLKGKKLADFCDFFKESLTKEEEYYVDVLNGVDKGNYTISYVCDNAWVEKIKEKKEMTAYDWYVVGIIEYFNENYGEAERCFEKSLATKREYYALVALSLYVNGYKHDFERAYQLMKEAYFMNEDDRDVFLKFAEIAIKSGNWAEFVEIANTRCDRIREYGRTKMYIGHCYVLLGELEKAKELINKDLMIADMREGEYSVSYIWTLLYKKQIAKDEARAEEDITDKEVLEKYPLPYEIDFRQH